MSSRNLILQAVPLSLLLTAPPVFGCFGTAAVIATAVLLVAFLVLALTRQDANVGPTDRPEDLRAAFAVIAVGPFLAAAVVATTGTVEVPTTRIPTVQAMSVLAAAAFAGLWLSSLIDYRFTLPRMRGRSAASRGPSQPPCLSSLDRYWRSVTRIWLTNRLAAQLGFVVCLMVTVALAASEWLGLDQTLGAAIAAAATILAGFYLTRARSVLAFIVHPVLSVGDQVLLAEEYEVGYKPVPYYVVDVAFEGIGLLRVPTGVVEPDASAQRGHDRVLDVADASRLLRERNRYLGCDEETCRLVNPYCARARQILDAAAANASKHIEERRDDDGV